MHPVYRLAADDAELEAAFELHRQVFVQEQCIPSESEFDGLDSEAMHVVVMDGGDVIGTARFRLLASSQAKIERKAVSEVLRLKGVGRGIVSFVVAEARRKLLRHVVLHPQQAAVPFYRSCGFEEVGQPFCEAGIMHLKMQMWL